MNIVVMDLYHRGHHRSYIEMVCRHWVDGGYKGTLHVLVNSSFVLAHPQFVSWVDSLRERGLRLCVLPEVCEIPDSSGLSGLLRANTAHERAIKEALSYQPEHILCMFFDHAQLAIRRLDNLLRGVSVSGILFRPTLHEPATSIGSRISRFRKQLFLKRAIKSTCFNTLFSLDPDAVDSINGLVRKEIATFLPDGTDLLKPDVSPAELRAELDIPSSQKVLLLFGALSTHKGVVVALKSLSFLSPTIRQQVTLVLAGKVDSSEREMIIQHIEAAKQDGPVILVDEFVSEERMTAMFDMADIVLAPYQFHVGSSGVLIRAASASKPVVGSDYGMVGRTIKRHSLGATVDSTSAADIAQGIERILQTEQWEAKDSAKDFVNLNSSSQFANTLLERLYGA